MKDYLWSVRLFGLSSDRQQLGTGVHQTNSWGCFFSFSSSLSFSDIQVEALFCQYLWTGHRRSWQEGESLFPPLLKFKFVLSGQLVLVLTGFPLPAQPDATLMCWDPSPPPTSHPSPRLHSWIRSSSRRDQQCRMPNFHARHRCWICHYRFYRGSIRCFLSETVEILLFSSFSKKPKLLIFNVFTLLGGEQ